MLSRLTRMTTLSGKKGVIVGVANENSLVLGSARHFPESGADLATAYVSAKAQPFVRPWAEELGSSLILLGIAMEEVEIDVAHLPRLAVDLAAGPAGASNTDALVQRLDDVALLLRFD